MTAAPSRFLERARLFFVICATLIFSGVLPGSALVSVVLLDAETEEPAPVPPEVTDRVGTVRVTVRDATGNPVAGAIVRAIYAPTSAATAGGNATGEVYLAARVVSDANGVATLAHLPVGAHWIIAEARGKARASTQRFVGEDPVDIELRLGVERPFVVEVRDDQGRAVVGAEVIVSGADPLPRGATVGADGLAHPTGLGDGPLRLVIRAPGYDAISTAVGAGEPRVKVLLKKLGALVVTVVDASGKTVEGATVAIAGGALGVPRMTTTGKDGAARIGGLGVGSYDLRAIKGDLVSPVEIGISLRRGADATARLVLEPGRELVLHVIDEVGRDLKGAEVVAVEGGLSPFPMQATTDATGHAHVGPIPLSAIAAVGARATGFVARGPLVVPAGASAEPIEILLRRSATLLGDVRDGKGSPIDGATIEVVGTDLDGLPIDVTPASIVFSSALFARISTAPNTLLPIGELGVVPGPVPPIPHGPIGMPPGAAAEALAGLEPWVTRYDGSFKAAPVPAGRLRAIVRHPAYVEGMSEAVVVEPGGEGRVTVTLAAGGRLEGRVKDERGSPVEGAWIEVSARAGSLTRGVRTASDGTFVLAAVPTSISITLAAPDKPYEPVFRTDATVPEGGVETIELVLPAPRPATKFHVVDDRRYPVVGAQISVASLDPTTPVKVTAFSDDRGEAELSRVGGLKVQVEVRAPGHAPYRNVVDVIGATLEIELAQGLLVKGVVYAPGGRTALEGATVTLITDAGLRRVTSDKDGRFSFADAAKGDGVVEVRAKGAAPIKVPVSITPKGSIPEVDLGRLEMLAAGTVEGEVVDEKGRPVAGARVARDRAPTYVPATGAPQGVAISDASGAFKLVDVAAGSAEIEAYSADVGRGRSEIVRIDEGRTLTHVKIVLHPTAPTGDGTDLAPGGVAITLAEENGKITVAKVESGSEAERAGLLEGDEIVSIDGAAPTTLGVARARLSGPLGEDVVVRLRRGGSEKDLRVPREAIVH